MKAKTMKAALISLSVIIVLTVSILFVFYFWIRHDLKENIEIAQQQHPGKAEDALIAYLLDENNSPRGRSAIAVWSLGQLKSQKALPVLYSLYMNDPEGKTCRGHHDTMICQRGIYTAIKTIEGFSLFPYGNLKNR